MPAGTLKQIKGGKTDEDPSVKYVTLRGVEYTIREIDVNEYDQIVEEVANPDTGLVRFDKLLRAMVMRCVRPLPSKPWKFPVYRTLETIVNDMHYADVPEDKKAEDEVEETEDEGTKVPNPSSTVDS